MTLDSRLNDIRANLGRPQSVADVRAALAELDQLGATEPVPEGLEALREHGLYCLRSLTASDPAAAAEALLQDMLPRCLYPETSAESKRSRYNNFFGDWLGELPEEQRTAVRSAALPVAMTALADVRARSAMRLVASIGFADPAVIEALDGLIGTQDNEIGDQALSVRLWLRSTPETRHTLRTELHRRMVLRQNVNLLLTARRVGDPSTIDVLFATQIVSGPQQKNVLDFDFSLDLLATITSRFPDDDLPTRTWRRVVALEAVAPEVIPRVLARSGLASSFDTAAVIPELLSRACRVDDWERYLLYLRLSECVRPSQIPGWAQAATSGIEPIQGDATHATSELGRWRTVEFDRKEEAWSVLLSLGNRELLPPFDDTIMHERNGYSINHFLGLAACLALNPLPPVVAQLLAGPPSGYDWSNDEYTAAQIGAIEAAHGAATLEAFDALLGYRPIRDGVLLSVIDALAEVTGRYTRAANHEPLRRLLDAAEVAPDENTRSLAAGAVAVLLEDGVIPISETSRVSRLAAETSTDPYCRRALLYGFAARPVAETGPELLAAANELARPDRRVPPEETGASLPEAALVLLARQPGVASDRAFLAGRLGLRLQDEVVDVGPSLPDTGTTPYILGLLLEQEPERFAGVAAALIRQGRPAALTQLLPAIIRLRRPVSQEIETALIDRARQMDDGVAAVPVILDVLAEVAPDRLISEEWPLLERWLPEARSALAEVLGRLGRLEPARGTARLNLLRRLAGDGLFAVRRASYRALSECDPSQFESLLSSWASFEQPGGEGLRRRAAEGVGWVPSRPANGPLAALEWDPEPTVRETFSRSLADREERTWAAAHESHILGVVTPDEVIRCWRYGVALGSMGDDRTLTRLEERMQADLPPAVRYWLARVQKSVQSRWDDVVKKWPEPLFARPGHVEAFSGAIRKQDGSEIEVTGTLWLSTPEQPNERSSWGGWATASRPVTGNQDSRLLLILPERSPANILVTSFQLPSGILLFTGSGSYPTTE